MLQRKHLTAIDRRLAGVGGGRADTTRDTLTRLSPQSLQLTLEMLAWGKQRTLHECLAAERRVTRDVVRTPGFIEGIRAALVDNDRDPAWNAGRVRASWLRGLWHRNLSVVACMFGSWF